MRYDAFLSYSHRADRLRAVAMQRLLQTLAKPFYRWKALHIFRDETGLAANPRLWPTIERAARKAQPKSPLIAKREWWLAALAQGRNPFVADVLAALRKREQ